jgi:hypothetical protein
MMKTLATALLSVLLVSAVLVPADPSFSQELYGWTISASSTDPFVHTAPPVTGFYSVYAWLVCITSEVFGIAGFQVDGTLADRILGFSAIPPFGLVTGEEGLAPFISEGDCLASGAHPAFEIFVSDGLGAGGSLCIVELDTGGNMSCNCDLPYPQCFPNAVIGFASDGTDPCVTGFCQSPPISVESQSWSSMKAKYRE